MYIRRFARFHLKTISHTRTHVTTSFIWFFSFILTNFFLQRASTKTNWNIPSFFLDVQEHTRTYNAHKLYIYICIYSSLVYTYSQSRRHSFSGRRPIEFFFEIFIHTNISCFPFNPMGTIIFLLATLNCCYTNSLLVASVQLPIFTWLLLTISLCWFCSCIASNAIYI